MVLRRIATLNSADNAGGGRLIPGPNNLGTIAINGQGIATFGDLVEDHSPNDDDEHDDARLISGGTSNVFGYGFPLIREGDIATCGHSVVIVDSRIFTNS